MIRGPGVASTRVLQIRRHWLIQRREHVGRRAEAERCVRDAEHEDAVHEERERVAEEQEREGRRARGDDEQASGDPAQDESEVRRRLEAQGYTQVTGLKMNSHSMWRGKAMKAGKSVPFRQRYDKIAPVIGRTFDLEAIVHQVIGLRWASLPAEQQAALTDAFRRYTVASYVANFDAYTGERFELLATISTAGNDRDTGLHRDLAQEVDVSSHVCMSAVDNAGDACAFHLGHFFRHQIHVVHDVRRWRSSAASTATRRQRRQSVRRSSGSRSRGELRVEVRSQLHVLME